MNISDLTKFFILTSAGKKTKVVSPSPKNPPKNLSKKALELWPEFYKTYGKAIRAQGDDPIERWKVAVAIFKNYCLKRNIPPFDAKASYLNQETQDYMRNRLFSNRNKLFEKSVNTISAFVKKGFVKKVTNETIADIKYNKAKSVYSIVTTSDLILDKKYNNKSKELVSLIKHKGFDKKKDSYIYSIGTHTVTIVPGEKPDRFTIINTLNFNPQNVKYILGLQDEDLKDIKYVLKGLGKEAKDFLKRDRLNTMVVSGVIKKLNFESELPEDQKKLLESTITNLKSSNLAASELRARYPLEKIRSLGDPLYQLNFIKSLVGLFESYPDEEKKKVDISSWQAVVENPSIYLDPDSLKLADIKDSEDPESAI